MDFILREDIAAPVAQVFAQATDFAAFERQALRRGADLRRLDRMPQPGPGAAWRAVFPFRGREREVELRLDRIESPVLAEGGFRGQNLEGRLRAECLALSRTTTRLTLTLTVEGRTLPARLFVQSLRLARGNLERRAGARLAAWARDVEGRWQRRPARV
jgi:hypothetical protein